MDDSYEKKTAFGVKNLVSAKSFAAGVYMIEMKNIVSGHKDFLQIENLSFGDRKSVV